VPNGGPSGKGKASGTFFKPDGGRTEALGEDHCGRLKDRNKMERRLNGIQARHSSVRDMYEVALRDTPEGVRLFWQVKENRRGPAEVDWLSVPGSQSLRAWALPARRLPTRHSRNKQGNPLRCRNGRRTV